MYVLLVMLTFVAAMGIGFKVMSLVLVPERSRRTRVNEEDESVIQG
jgi:hypothetical protein